MMLKPYFDQRKRKMFPWITDWSDPQTKLRTANVNNLNYLKWIWFHPSAYCLIHYGSHALGVLAFGGLATLLFLKNNGFIALLLVFLSLYMLYRLISKIKLHKINKNMNLYDIYMREEKLEEFDGL